MDYEGMTDEALIARYNDCHDNKAMATLVQRHQLRLIAIFVRGGLFGVAEDLANDVWVRVMNTAHHLWNGNAQPFSPASGVPFVAWLSVIARRLRSDTLQVLAQAPHQMPKEVVGQEPFEQTIPNSAESPDAAMIAHESSVEFNAAYRECLLALGDGHREVFLLEQDRLACESEPTQSEWARKHDLLPATYRTNLHRARGQILEGMKQKLGPNWGV